MSRRSVERDATRAKQVVVFGEIVDTSLDKGAEIDALAKLPKSEQRSLAKAAKRGEKVSARSACDYDPEDPKLSDGTEKIELGKAISRVRRAQPRNADTMFICDALERRLRTEQMPAGSQADTERADRQRLFALEVAQWWGIPPPPITRGQIEARNAALQNDAERVERYFHKLESQRQERMAKEREAHERQIRERNRRAGPSV